MYILSRSVFNSPFPFPAHPDYLFVTPAFYFSALFTPKPNFLSFANTLISASKNSNLRQFILPIHSFDFKYSYSVQNAVIPPESGQEEEEVYGIEEHGNVIGDEEKALLLKAYNAWKTSQGYQQKKQTILKEKNKGKAKEVEEEEEDEPNLWTIERETALDWINQLELIDTLLQCLVLLTIIALPPPPPLASPPPVLTDPTGEKPKKKKVKKVKDPERHAETLDPELLLDFMTDRIQIWRVMRDVKSLDSTAGNGGNSSEEKENKDGDSESEDKKARPDIIHMWWTDVVEPLFSSRLPDTLLSLHRSKLFITRSNFPNAISTRLEPQPSPFAPKDRSLLSLDRSARRKTEKEERGRVAESPTMKRLTSGNLGRMLVDEGQREEVFKVPTRIVRPSGATNSNSGTASSLTATAQQSSTATGGSTTASSTRTRPLRKQDNPRPLPRRGDSLSSMSSKTLFANSKRREVSLPPASGAGSKGLAGGKKRRISGVTGANEQGKEKEGVKDREERPDKRKSLSPRKLPSAASSTTLLVPSPDAVSPQAPFSFAALGAAWRPGGGPQGGVGALSFGPAVGKLPPAPVLPQDRMDWTDLGDTTPKKPPPRWVVPDT